MKSSISKKLFRSATVVLFFIILIALAGDICIRILKKTSNLIVVEYLELESIQNLRYSISQLVNPVNSYMFDNDPNQYLHFRANLSKARTALKNCNGILTVRHNRSPLEDVRENFANVENLGEKLFADDQNHGTSERLEIQGQIRNIIETSLTDILILQTETKDEINNYVNTNRTAIMHSRITIAFLGILLAVIVVLGSYFFIKKLTTPIVLLMGAIKKAASGDFQAKVEVSGRDELGILANAFNDMLERIEQVTVSRNFYNNVLNSMFNGLIIADSQGTITSLNEVAIRIMGDSEENLIGRSVKSIFSDPLEYEKIKETTHGKTPHLQIEATLMSVKGTEIPVILAGTVLQDELGTTDNYVIVFHDLTERKKIESALEQIRKERIIAINEAQEKERLRIATDLHDGLGQILTSASYSLQNLTDGSPEVFNKFKEQFSHIREQINMAIEESKRISHNLIPLALKDFGLIPAITRLINQVNQQGSIRFSFDTFNMEERIDQRLEKALYRTCQEAVNNILKHSGAASAYIQLIRHEKSVVLMVEDDGIGFNDKDPGNYHTGIGLATIKERAITFGGTLIIHSDINSGTELIIEIPCMNSKL